MAANTIKQPKEKQTGQSTTIFSLIDQYLKIDFLVKEGLPVKYLPHVLWLTFLTVFYIGNIHSAERTVRKIDQTKQEVEDLRADYTTLKSDFMYFSKQSEVAKKVAPFGLEESKVPPFKIVIKDGEY